MRYITWRSVMQDCPQRICSLISFKRLVLSPIPRVSLLGPDDSFPLGLIRMPGRPGFQGVMLKFDPGLSGPSTESPRQG